MSPTLKNLKEEAFERHIFDALGRLHDYRKRDAEEHYDRALALDPELLFEFLSATQSAKLDR